jgi:hypothetical protein
VLDENAGKTDAVTPDVEDLKGAQLDSVMVDQRLFAVPSRYSRVVELLEKRARRLRRKVQKDTATPEEREKLIAALDRLQELYAAEERRQGDKPLLSEIAKVQLALLKKLERQLSR